MSLTRPVRGLLLTMCVSAAVGAGCSGNNGVERHAVTQPAPTMGEAERAIMQQTRFNSPSGRVRIIHHCAPQDGAAICSADYDDHCDQLVVTKQSGDFVIKRTGVSCIHVTGISTKRTYSTP